MKVKELIEALQKMPQDIDVVTDGEDHSYRPLYYGACLIDAEKMGYAKWSEVGKYEGDVPMPCYKGKIVKVANIS